MFDFEMSKTVNYKVNSRQEAKGKYSKKKNYHFKDYRDTVVGDTLLQTISHLQEAVTVTYLC